MGKIGINYWADKGEKYLDRKEVTKCINPGLMHFDIRIACFGHASDVLNDNKDVSAGYGAIIEPKT
ncbi:hypothetical protein EBA24_18165 [Xanthomonas oryzae pv. oryzae]|nr:hypothetical protein EBA22_18180 [Xanthomonas oryzae pv. oryzae]QBO10979.1 hypothetical protein EBA23_18190 [Xanthomonas oryzae pv. oryzae]QBO14759.1 hypothetical protein EBA24_18165 [Xanthomonas oryzae pv. oryzae]QBO18566.1 hypothetical protein EBA25_18195 [Xanthomonas oryzae pv. oryzae]